MGGPSGKKKRLSPGKPALLKACIGVLARSAERYTVQGLHKDFPKKKQTANLTNIFTEAGLQGMRERIITVLLMQCFCLTQRSLTEAAVL